MDHPCHQCGAAVEDGARVCPSCGAPQIRVTGLDPTPSPLPPLPAPEATTITAPANIDWPQALPAAAMSGAAVGFFSLIPILGLGCCLWMLTGGGLCVALYRRRRIGAHVTTGMGARMGAISGVFAFFTYAIGMALELLLLRGPGLQAALRQAVEQSASRNPDPRAQEILQRLISPGGMALLITIAMVMFFLAFVIFSSIGGALWASMGSRERR